MNTIYNFTINLIEEIKHTGRYSTAGVYISTVNSFLSFTGDKNITFKDLTPKYIKQYEELLLNKGKRHNSISTYMRMLRAIANQASDRGIVFSYPVDQLFEYTFTGYEPTAKRAVAPSIVKALSRLELSQQPSLCFSRDMFMLSFYLCGIPFVDMAHLRKSDIRNNTIYYYRQKTNHQLSVIIEYHASEIIYRYYNKEASSPYLLPILTTNGERGYRQYKSALRLYNQHLHILSEKLNLNLPLTSYVARHSWASIAKNEGVPISLISESLGHSSEQVTHHYLTFFDINTLNAANRKVIEAVHSSDKL